jgi:ceramide glucosyltransferase
MQVKRFVRKDTADLSLVLLRDLLSFAVFIGSFWPGSIEWRGHRFGVRSDGLLTTRDNTGR